jgi:phosphatidylglycerol:prolipoprotein diacylglycerol transferase
MLPYIYFDDTPFPMYSVMALLGIAFVIIVGLAKHKALHLRKRDILRLVFWATVGALLGAKLFGAIGHIIKHGSEPDFWTPEVWFRIANAGGVFYGGLLGALSAATLRAKLGHIDVKTVFNFAAYATFAFQSLGRLSCYCAGCCYGITLASGARFPIQLVEAGFCLIVLLTLLIVRPERRWPKLPLLPIGLIIYSAGRFIFEFFRGDANRGVWILSTSQWIGLALISVAVIWLKKSAKNKMGEQHES